MISTKLRLAAAAGAAVATLVLAACGSGNQDVQIGLERQGANLAFSDPALNPRPKTVFVYVPATSGAAAALLTPLSYPTSASAEESQSGGPFVYRSAPPCPKAPPGATPSQRASMSIEVAPLAGNYGTHNQGTFDYSSSTYKLKGPYPPATNMSIKNVKRTVTSSSSGDTVTIAWDVTLQGLAGSTTTTSYQATPSELDLVKQVVTTQAGSSTFAPASPVEIMGFGGLGSTWTSEGVDPKTGTVMKVSGEVAAEEAVDVCGTRYDSYKVVSNEQVINIIDGTQSQTSASDPNIYWVATELGGVFLAEHIDESESFPSGSGTATLTVDETSTLDSVKPAVAGR